MHIYTCTLHGVPQHHLQPILHHQSSITHCTKHIYIYMQSHKHTHTYTVSSIIHTLHLTTKPFPLIGINRASTKVYMPCACPASTPFEHVISNRHDCRLTGLAQPRYPCPASKLTLLQHTTLVHTRLQHISCSVTTIINMQTRYIKNSLPLASTVEF